MTHLVFVDTETTGLEPHHHEIWEVAVIVRGHPDSSLDGEWCWLLQPLNLGRAGGDALRVGRFYSRVVDRLLHVGDVKCTSAPGTRMRHEWSRSRCAAMLALLTQDATFIANNAHFDARFIEKLLREEGVVPAWDYRVIDVVAMAAAQLREPLPWRSEQLSRKCDVAPPVGEQRHSALGDARWVERWWDYLDPEPATTINAEQETP